MFLMFPIRRLHPNACSTALSEGVTTENPQLQLVIVAGNHDSAARLEAPLPLLQEMRTDIKGIVRRRDGEIVTMI